MKICNEYRQGPGFTSAILFIFGKYPNYWQFRIGTGQIALWKPDYVPVFNWIFGAARRAMSA
jgi:hypothetical protein